MSNQVAIKTHTQPGDDVLVEARAHIACNESGAPGVLSGVGLKTVTTDFGFLSRSDVAGFVKPRYDWLARSSLVCLENSFGATGGRVYPPGVVGDIASEARSHSLAVHLDGARLWNAAVALDMPERVWSEPCDSVSVCLSKGLGAPVGSVLAGSVEFITRARRYRKMFGGGMRQVGVLAAAGLYALQHHRKDLARTHDYARRIAGAVAAVTGFSIDLPGVQTNIVRFETAGNASACVSDFAARGVRALAVTPTTVRMVTHRDLSDEDVDDVVTILLGMSESDPALRAPTA